MRGIAEDLSCSLCAGLEDRKHPSLAGTYLSTAVVYATIFGKDPTSVAYAPAGLTPEDATFLRRVAFATVRAYSATPPSTGNR